MKVKAYRQIAFFVVLSSLVSVLAASADWSAPSATFPTCPAADPACNTPINVGVQFQEKRGPFRVQGLFETLAGTTLATLSGKVGIGTNTVDSRADVRLHVAKQGGGDAIITGVLAPVNDNDAANKAYVDAQVGGGAKFFGFTTATYKGGLGGVNGANAKCQLQWEGSHMCRYEEIIASGETGSSLTSGTSAWVIDDIYFSEKSPHCASKGTSGDLPPGTDLSNCSQWGTTYYDEDRNKHFACAAHFSAGSLFILSSDCVDKRSIACCGN